MSEFLLRRENSPGLKKWVPIKKLALKNNNQARVNSFTDSRPGYLHFYDVPDEKLDGLIKNESDNIFPAVTGVLLSATEVYAERSYFDSGSLCCFNRQLKIQNAWNKHSRCKWRDLFPQEFISAGNKLVVSIWQDAGSIRKKMEES